MREKDNLQTHLLREKDNLQTHLLREKDARLREKDARLREKDALLTAELKAVQLERELTERTAAWLKERGTMTMRGVLGERLPSEVGQAFHLLHGSSGLRWSVCVLPACCRTCNAWAAAGPGETQWAGTAAAPACCR